MRDFSKVSPRVWRDKKFRDLTDSDARLLWIYLMTNEHQNSAGCYRLPFGYAVSDLGWEIERFETTFHAVIAAGAAMYDIETEEVFVTDWFRDNPAMNDKHAVGISKILARIESPEIREAASSAFEETEAGRALRTPVGKTGEVFSISDSLTKTKYLNRSSGAR